MNTDPFKILKEIYGTRKECIGISATPLNEDEDLEPWMSKLGGIPYVPNGMTYPRDKAGNPMYLLAQINFVDLPGRVDPFPTEGILQFYISDDDYCGMSFSETDRGTYEVRYIPYQTVYDDQSDLSFLKPLDFFPIERVHRLSFYRKFQPVPLSNPLFEDLFDKYLNEQDLEPDFFELYAELIDEKNGIQMGGYPEFTQSAPVFYEDGEYDTQLLQIDSNFSNHIEFGDCGIANFFINKKDLKKLDFSNVGYYWDCS